MGAEWLLRLGGNPAPIRFSIDSLARSTQAGFGLREVRIKPLAQAAEYGLPNPERLGFQNKDATIYVANLPADSFYEAEWGSPSIYPYHDHDDISWSPARIDQTTGCAFTYIPKDYRKYRYFIPVGRWLSRYGVGVLLSLGLLGLASFIGKPLLSSVATSSILGAADRRRQERKLKQSVEAAWRAGTGDGRFPRVNSLQLHSAPGGAWDVELTIESQRKPNDELARRCVERDVAAVYRGIYGSGVLVAKAAVTAALDLGVGPAKVHESMLLREKAHEIQWARASDGDVLSAVTVLQFDETVLGPR